MSRLLLGTFLLVASAGPTFSQSLDEARDLHIGGDYRAALAAYAKAIEEAGSSDPASAATAHNNSCVIHNGFGEYAQARGQCRRAIALRRQLDDPRRLARTLNNLAIAEQNLGEYEAASESFHGALEINTHRDDALSQVLNLSNLGALATLRGRYAEALEYHRRATDLAAAHPRENWSTEQLQVATINRGVVLEQLGAYRQALELYVDLVETQTAEMSERRLAQLKLNRGVVYRNLGDPVRAVRDFEEVAATYERLEDPDGLSNALLNLALALDLGLERFDEAEDAYRRALGLASLHQDRPEEIRDLFYLGHFLVRRGRLQEAADVYRRCLEVADRAGSIQGRWAALAGLGRIAAAQGDYAAAAVRLSAAIDEIEGMGADLGEPGLRVGFFGDRRPVYAEAAQILAELHRLEPEGGHAAAAFLVAQRAKARALLDTLGGRRWTAQPLSAGAIQGKLDRPLVEYFGAAGDLLRWKIGPGGLEMRNLGPHRPILDAVRGVYADLESGSRPDVTELADLSATLLAGLELREAGPGALYFAPVSELERLPFELLTVPGRERALVADLFAVGYVPSASTLVWLRERDAPAAAGEVVGLRGFADPRLALHDPDSAAGLVADRFSLKPLREAARTLDALSRHLRGPSELFVGEAASEAAWRSTAPRPARVVHLAAHAVVDERPGRGAAVLLTPGQGHDGLLEPREIAAFEQRSELVVLAACRSALGEEGGGGLSTLSGAFLAAGASGVVATLWDVGDGATAVFMDRFYRHLGRGREPAEALRLAKGELREDRRWDQPHLWAAYVLVGDAHAVVDRPLWSGRLLVVVAVLVVTLLLVARRRRG